MNNFPVPDFLKSLDTLARKSDFLWTSATGKDTILLTAMLVQLDEGLPALPGLFSELDPLEKMGKMHKALDSFNFVEMHLFPGSSGLFFRRSTLRAELSLPWQTDLFLDDPLHNAVSEISWGFNLHSLLSFF